MALTPDPSATIEQMHAQAQEFGTPEQRALADDILYGHKNVGIGLKLSMKLHRDAMAKLLGEMAAN